MADLMMRVKMSWTGFQGGPGISSFYFKEFQDGTGIDYTQAQVDGVAIAVRSFAQGINGVLAPGVILQVESDVEIIESSDGSLVDVKTAANQTAQAAIGNAGTPYSAASGAVINWRTGLVHRNRRVRGRTFLVPLAGPSFESNGTLAAATVATIGNAANALRTAADTVPLGVWARPERVKDANGNPTKETIPNGAWGRASSHNVPDLAAVLRSRRD